MPRTAAKSAVMKREPARRQPWSLGHTPDSENFVNIAVVKLKLVVSLFKLFILKLYFSFKKFYVIFLVCARRQTLTKTDSDQAAFSILATKLHGIEQSSLQKELRYLVAQLAMSHLRCCSAVSCERNLCDNIAGVTSVLGQVLLATPCTDAVHIYSLLLTWLIHLLTT